MIGTHSTIRVALMLSILLLSGQLLADDSGREVAVEINKANGLLRSGDIDAAVKAYNQVQGVARDREELSYNMAVAQYRKGDMAAAEQLFEQSSTAENDAIAAKARYNLGNCNYASALRQAETDRPAAIKGLMNAIANYRSALEIEPNDADSRANIELAATMIEKLREQEKREQQHQSQDQKQQQQPNQEQQKVGDQKEQKQEGSKSSDKNQQKESQQEQEQQNNQQQKPKSSEENNSKVGQGAQDRQQKPGDDAKNQSAAKNESQSKDSQSEPQDSKSESPESKLPSQQQSKSTAIKPKQPQSPNDSQSPRDDTKDDSGADKQPGQPTQQPRSAAQKKSTDKRPEQDVAQQSEDQNDQQGRAAPKGALSASDQKSGHTDPQSKDSVGELEIEQDGAMTMQEAEKMLQAIRDQEMIRRLKRQAAERNQQMPVDRDW